MKKLLTLLTVSLLALPFATFASSISLSSSSSIEAGQTFSLTIVVNPGENDYTVKAALAYPADLLQVVSFVQAPGWFPLSQPGYDSVDNASGSLIKTAGFSGGFSSSKVFGTVTFRAVAPGTAIITAGSNTQILDANNANTFTSGGGVTITITPVPVALPVIPIQKAVPNTNTSNPSRTPLTPVKSNLAQTPLASETEASSTPVATTSAPVENIAAVESARTQETSIIIGILSTLIAFGFGLAVGKRQKA